MSKSVDEILQEAAKTFAIRDEVYGSRYKLHGKTLLAMFPEGIELLSADDFNRFTLLAMVVAKLERYASNFDQGGHQDSIHDAMVYSAMLESLDEEINQ